MNRIKNLFLIFVGICYISNMSYACTETPVAGVVSDFYDYDIEPSVVTVVGEAINLNGLLYSYDPDDGEYPYDPGEGITQWHWRIYDEDWDFVDDMSGSQPSFELTTTAGYYNVFLWVKDNDNTWSGSWSGDPYYFTGYGFVRVYVSEVGSSFWLNIDDDWYFDEGPIYVPIDTPFDIYADSNPNSGDPYYYTYFPEDEPAWEITDTPEGVDPEDVDFYVSNSGYCYGGGDDKLTFDEGIAEPGTYTLEAEAGTSNDDIDIVVVKVDLKSVDFLGTGNHTLRKQDSDEWTNDNYGDNGTPITEPEWQDLDLDGAADKDDPVCYTQSSSPEMTAMIHFNLIYDISAKVKVKNGTTTLVTKDITLSDIDIIVDDLIWSSPLPDTLLTSDYTLTWSISFDGGITYNDFGTSTTRFFVVLNDPDETNSCGSDSYLTCKRISEVLDNAGTTSYIGTIAPNIQQWRDDFGIDTSGRTSGTDGAKIWALLDGTEKGQCKEGSLLMEQAVRLLGIEAEWQHVLAGTGFPIRVSTASITAYPEFRQHCSTIEDLLMWFANAGNFSGWNVGEGCCLVDGKLYAAFTNNLHIGQAGSVVDFGGGTLVTAASAAHHILLLLEKDHPNLQRWCKRNGVACNDGDTESVPGMP